MNNSAKKIKVLKTEPEIKGQKIKGSLDKKSIENIPEINSKFFENCLDAIMITAQDGKIYSANPAACIMLGYDEKDICKLGRKGVVEQNSKLEEALKRRKESGKFLGELIFIKKDGTRFPAEISSSVFTNSDGSEMTVIIIRDITERKKTEKSLQESEARLRLASQATGFGIYSYDFVNRVSYFSDEFLALYGILTGNTIEHNIDLLSRSFHPEDKEYFLNANYKANDPEGSGILDVEFRIIKPDGEIRWLKARGRTIFSGNSRKDKPLHSNGLIQDITERKVIENAIKQAHDWQETIFEGSIDAIFISGRDAHLIAVNKAACDLTGYSREQLLTMSIPDLHEEKDLEAFHKYNERIFNGEKILSEAKILRRDGIKIDTEFNNSCISVSGKCYMHTTARDITERKIIEDRITTSESEYRSLFENSIMGISQALPDGKILRINKAYTDMYGYPDTSTMLRELTHGTKILYSNPDDRKKVLKILDEHGFMTPTEFELNKRNGEKFWALVSAKQVKDETGKLLYMQAEHFDITSRKKLEKEMYSASHYARNLIEASLDPLATISINGTITDVNKATEQIIGIKRENLIGTDFTEYFTEPDKAKEGYETVFKNGTVMNWPLSVLHTSGEKIDVLYNATLFRNEAGEVQGVFAAARDITDRKIMEEELRKSHELLEKLNQHLLEVRENERNQIALNLHDDLGQKLTGINFDIAWLKSRIGVQSKIVCEKFEEMSSMIKETIESIRETSAFLRPAILFDLGLVPAIKSQLNNFEKQTGIRCHFSCDPEEELPNERISLILYRILQESLTNIARHSEATDMEVELLIVKDKVEMLIKDNGIGIRKEHVNSLKSMGIAGMKERIKSVSGKITIRGVKGSGTRIKIFIPLNKSDE